MKILLICNDSNTTINFRKELILFLKKKCFDIYCICGDEARKEEIIDLGVAFFFVPLKNRSTNPFNFFLGIKKIKEIIKQINPDIVMTFQIKPNIIGSIAAHKAGALKIYNMVEGLGDPFQGKGLKWKIIRKLVCVLYKKSFKYAEKIFFLNNDDRDELVHRKLIDIDKSIIIHGIGIDTSKYLPVFLLNNEKNVIMLSRLIKNKGIIDYCELAKEVKKTRKDINFYLYGAESELRRKDILEYINNGTIIYGGYVKDINEKIINSRIVVSTSYREGFPRTILEAMALGRITIASNVIGNKDVVIDNETGFLLPVHDCVSFATKIINVIDNDDLLLLMGKKAREICMQLYDSNTINQQILNILLDKKVEII